MKRRLFSALFASAPALALPVETASPLTVPGMNFANKCGGILKAVTPLSPLEILQRKNTREYHNAIEKANQLVYRRIQAETETRVSHNIMALRSVSPQHKARMFKEWERNLHEENKSWAQKLAESLGVVEREDGVYPAESQAGTGSIRGY